MKSLIVAFIFAIGLLISLPSTSSGSKAPPGQSFVISQFDFAPAAMLQAAMINQTPFVVYNSVCINALTMEGGGTVEKSLNTSLDIGNLNKDVTITKVPAYKLNCDFGFLLCHYTKVTINQNTTKNIQSDGPITIRADSHV